MVRKTKPKSEYQVSRLRGLHGLEVVQAKITEFRFPVHTHDTFVLEWITAGADRCSASGQVARSGQLLVHGPGEPHAGQAEPGQALGYRACYPGMALLAEVLDEREDQMPVLGTLVLESPAVERDALRLFGELAKGRESRDVRAAMRELMLRVLEREGESSRVGVGDSLPRAIRKARAHLMKHLERDVSGEELAQVSGLSRFHLIREFKRSLGITPRQFLISQRVSCARRLLAGGGEIADVAFATGFADQSHLARHLKRLTGLRPGQLRKAGAANGNSVQ